MANMAWIKINTGIFDDEKIVLIETMPEADSLLIIWFKLLCISGKINNGGVLMLGEKTPYTDEMIATVFRRPLETVKLAFKTFEELGMVEVINETITIPNWSKHQSLDKWKDRKEYMREYMKKYREKQRKIACQEDLDEENEGEGEGVNFCKVNVNSLEEERELELELELEKDIYIHVVSHLNKVAGKKYKHNTKATRRLIDARLNEKFKLEDFKKVIDNKASSWKNDPTMNQYLRPATLFGSKFESYLNENTTSSKTNYGW